MVNSILTAIQMKKEKKSVCLLQKETWENFLIKSFNPKGKKCNAGKTYGQISPNGNVKKYGGWSEEENTFIGNIFDVDFKMLEEASIYNCYKCVENEWAFLL